MVAAMRRASVATADVTAAVDSLREDGTLLLHADQLVRDSNQDLRLAFNTSLLPAGGYVIRVEGYGRGGKLERFAEATLVAG